MTHAVNRRLPRVWRFVALGLFAGASGCDDYHSTVPLWPENTGVRDPALAGQWDMKIDTEEDKWFSQLPGAEHLLAPFLFLPLDDNSYYVVWRNSPEINAAEEDNGAWHFRGTCGVIGGVPLLQVRSVGFEEGHELDMPEPGAEAEYRFLRYAFTPEGELTLSLMLDDVFDREETKPADPEALRSFVSAQMSDPKLFENESIFRLRRLPRTEEAPDEAESPASAPVSAPVTDSASP